MLPKLNEYAKPPTFRSAAFFFLFYFVEYADVIADKSVV